LFLVVIVRETLIKS